MIYKHECITLALQNTHTLFQRLLHPHHVKEEEEEEEDKGDKHLARW